MADLNQPMKMEALDDASYDNEKLVRNMKVSALPNITPPEKSLYRQMVENNNTRNSLESVLRKINETTAVQGQAGNTFNIECKEDFQEKLRAALLQNYEAKAYLHVAEDMGYAAADAFKDGKTSEDLAIDDNIKKRIDEIKKQYRNQQQQIPGMHSMSLQQSFQPFPQQFPPPMQQMYGLQQPLYFSGFGMKPPGT